MAVHLRNGHGMAERILSAAVRPFKALFVSDAFEGVLLIAVAVLAIALANSAFANEYFELFHARLAWTPIPKLYNLHLWINDGLMAIFFFVIGLEVKREVIAGNLADPRQRRLPVLAAVAGMAAPALVYFWIAGTLLPSRPMTPIAKAMSVAAGIAQPRWSSKSLPAIQK